MDRTSSGFFLEHEGLGVPYGFNACSFSESAAFSKRLLRLACSKYCLFQGVVL